MHRARRQKDDKGLLFVVRMSILSLLEFFIFSSDALFSIQARPKEKFTSHKLHCERHLPAVGKVYGSMCCISQSIYSLIHVMIGVCYVIVNVIIFKACEKIFTSFSQRHIHRVFLTFGVYLCEMLPHLIYQYCLMMV